ncbi:MAG: hypothetical protein ACOYL5_13235 [Phototrophicaceae bacterium]
MVVRVGLLTLMAVWAAMAVGGWLPATGLYFDGGSNTNGNYEPPALYDYRTKVQRAFDTGFPLVYEQEGTGWHYQFSQEDPETGIPHFLVGRFSRQANLPLWVTLTAFTHPHRPYRIALSPADHGFFPFISPTGDAVAYKSFQEPVSDGFWEEATFHVVPLEVNSSLHAYTQALGASNLNLESTRRVVWSPNGRYVAYTTVRNDEEDPLVTVIQVFDTQTSVVMGYEIPPNQIVELGILDLFWSPDSTLLAFRTVDFRLLKECIHLIAVVGETRRHCLRKVNQMDLSRLAWSPSSQWLALVTTNSQSNPQVLRVLNSVGKLITSELLPHPSRTFAAQWVNDEQFLLSMDDKSTETAHSRAMTVWSFDQGFQQIAYPSLDNSPDVYVSMNQRTIVVLGEDQAHLINLDEELAWQTLDIPTVWEQVRVAGVTEQNDVFFCHDGMISLFRWQTRQVDQVDDECRGLQTVRFR